VNNNSEIITWKTNLEARYKITSFLFTIIAYWQPKVQKPKEVNNLFSCFFERPLATMTQSKVTRFVHIFGFPSGFNSNTYGLPRSIAIHIK
jgi:hypothetical protein